MSTSSTSSSTSPPTPDENDNATSQLALISSSSTVDDNSLNNNKDGSSTLAALSRAFFATLAFMFKRPIRLFRPVKISTWAGLQAIAEEQGKNVSASFVRSLIRKEGWKFFPRHVLPPMLVNTLIGLTLFTSYTTSERYFLTSLFPSPTSLQEFLYVPFLSGSIAGAAQSLLSAPLDNARLLLLRRQRYLRSEQQRKDKDQGDMKKKKNRRSRGMKASVRSNGGAFTNWISLLFQSSNTSPNSPITASSSSLAPTSTSTQTRRDIARQRVEQARKWARKGYSLVGLSLVKDSIGFGSFFAVFEIGREASRRIGLWIDGIPSDIRSTSSVEEEGRAIGEEKKRRTAKGLLIQALGILISGGIAGFVFSMVARPFERIRAAVWEGRTRWAERDSRLKMRDDLLKAAEVKRQDVVEGEEDKVVERRKRVRKRSRGGKSERRTKRLIVEGKVRKIGRVRVGQIRKGPRTLALLGRMKRRRIKRDRPLTTEQSNATTVPPRPRAPPPIEQRVPLPPASSFVLSALARYGTSTYLFAPRSVLQALDSRLPPISTASSSFSSSLYPSALSPASIEEKPLNSTSSSPSLIPDRTIPSSPRTKLSLGPTRHISRRQIVEAMSTKQGGIPSSSSIAGRGIGPRRWTAIFSYIPPYAVGFLVFALVQGDLSIEV